jgi:hypothetical protein
MGSRSSRAVLLVAGGASRATSAPMRGVAGAPPDSAHHPKIRPRPDAGTWTILNSSSTRTACRTCAGCATGSSERAPDVASPRARLDHDRHRQAAGKHVLDSPAARTNT